MTWPPDGYKHFSRWIHCIRCGRITVGGGLCADCRVNKVAQEIRQLRLKIEEEEQRGRRWN